MIPTLQRTSTVGSESLEVMCPRCAHTLGIVSREPEGRYDSLQCQACYFQMKNEDGIWRALPPDREKHFARFMSEYQIVRTAEGRGSLSPDYYLALPFEDLSGNNTGQWAVRARTYRALENSILPTLESRNPSGLDLVDLGAGNCWLSYRMSLRGHRPIAVDLITNDKDGLGAARHYFSSLPKQFPRFQAEADSLPFTSSQFDCVIFNASFHYSEDFVATLGEAVRCVKHGGYVIIADTPWYSREESGEQMISERQKAFVARFGFPSNGLKSQEYLTNERLSRLAQLYGLNWKVVTPSYGLHWAMRPWIARLKNSREPSQFRIYSSEVQK